MLLSPLILLMNCSHTGLTDKESSINNGNDLANQSAVSANDFIKAVNEAPQFGKMYKLWDSIHAIGYDISKSLPNGYVKNGTVDYTAQIQLALTKYDFLIFPAFPILVNDKGLQIHSNTKIIFEKGSQLILKASDKENYDIISIRDCKNVVLFNPSIKGDRSNHRSSGGEWGMAIGIYGSQNIKVFNPTVSDTWGDGIYIGAGSKTKIPSSQVYIEGARVSNSRRNGITITCAKGVTLLNAFVSKSNGTLPQDGINIEPNGPADEVTDINIINPRTEFNKGYGVEFSLSKMYGGSSKTVNAIISGHNDNGSLSAAYVSCDSKKSSQGEKISGEITFQKPIWKNYGTYVWRPYGLTEVNLKLALINPLLYPNDKLLGANETVAFLKREIYPKSSVYIFNVAP